MSTAVLIPYRATDEHREHALAVVAAHYATNHPDLPVIRGQLDPGVPWCKAVAVAVARQSTDADVLVIADADVMVAPAKLSEGIMLVAADIAQWCVPYSLVHRFTAKTTRDLMANRAHPSTDSPERAPYRGMIGGGITVVRASVYDDVPLDPRFVGWGGEDEAWGLALGTLAPRTRQIDGRCFHLWHPHSIGRARHTPEMPRSAELVDAYRDANGDVDAMQAIIEGISSGV